MAVMLAPETLTQTQTEEASYALPVVIARNPGQGSQGEGMGIEVAGDFDEANAFYKRGTEILRDEGRRHEGQIIDLKFLCEEAPSDVLNRNHVTQMVIFMSTVIAQHRLREQRPEIADLIRIRAGHSVGEYAALVDAGVLGFEEALLLVEARARFMTEAGRLAEAKGQKGGIGVVQPKERGTELELEVVKSLGEDHQLHLANINSPSQIGLSGELSKLEILRDELRKDKEGSMKLGILPVSVAVHNPDFMLYAEDRLAAYMEEKGIRFADPDPDSLVLNYSGKMAVSGTEVAMAAPMQITHPVLWYPGMEVAIGMAEVIGEAETDEIPEVVLLEVGPKTVLTGMDKHFTETWDNVRVISFQDAMKSGLDFEGQNA